MVYRLNSASILDYLARHKLCHSADRLFRVEKRPGKNLNLHVQLSRSGRRNAAINHLLVKQGPINCQEVPKGDFEDEWRIYQLLASHEELHDLQSLMPEGVHYDPVNAIQVFRYLQSYCDLGEFYADTQQFSATIATALGASLATLHPATFRRQDYRLELGPPEKGQSGCAAVDPSRFQL
ncbi:hypothetical protein [Synechococcus sp. CBW1006]|uniref:hypothetical protein n=1 Tax=Synechococcus sp. CBW1006 TaxID=1353138 RepID=UPI0018CCA29F|nr:hypothetical protein [Synechococcus sp. CBW1006]QPN67094.1 hypothetical protein H8F26_02055 [Synechococcus sp. CBW1006]